MSIPNSFVRVPAGAFIYGPEETYERLEQCPPPKPRQTLELDEFWIAATPVTYQQWKTFLDETGFVWRGNWWANRGDWRRRYKIVNTYPPEMANYPIVDVSQADAFTYCEWFSKKIGQRCTLPTEEQWEKAARGTAGRTYPWGEQHPRPELQWQKKFPVGPETYLYSLIVRPRRELARCGWYWRNGVPLPIGAIPENISPYGCLDMAGNIWEWTTSLYNPNLPSFHVVKGGSWGYTVHHTKTFVRSACSVTTPSAEYRAQGTGFRLVINPRVSL